MSQNNRSNMRQGTLYVRSRKPAADRPGFITAAVIRGSRWHYIIASPQCRVCRETPCCVMAQSHALCSSPRRGGLMVVSVGFYGRWSMGWCSPVSYGLHPGPVVEGMLTDLQSALT
ncbi:unnamed protein product [Arctogadus glacialis]